MMTDEELAEIWRSELSFIDANRAIQKEARRRVRLEDIEACRSTNSLLAAWAIQALADKENAT